MRMHPENKIKPVENCRMILITPSPNDFDMQRVVIWTLRPAFYGKEVCVCSG